MEGVQHHGAKLDRHLAQPRINFPERANAAGIWNSVGRHLQQILIGTVTLMLDAGFLDEFDARLRAYGAPICDAWAPGCSDEHIDALLRPLGIDLPEEARVWWRWHNGTRDDVRPRCRDIGTRGPFSIEDAAAAYRQDDGTMEAQEGISGLLASFNERPYIFFGCAGPHDEPVPIYTQNDLETPVVALPSIRSLLEAWLELIDVGAWELQADGLWLFHFERVPAHLLELGVY